MANNIQGVDYLKGFIFTVILAIRTLTGCTNTSIPSQRVDTDSEHIPTAPIASEWKTISESEKLIKLLDIDCDEIDSVLIIEYQDDIKTRTVIKKDAQSITEICDLLSSLSIVQAKTLSQERNTVYEITFYIENNKNTFLSFGPAFDGDIFSIGGSFIEYNNLCPYISIVQSNKTITFSTIETVLESLLADSK